MSMYDNIFDGKIYILISDQYEKFYIGSTTVSLEERLQRHIESYEEWLTSNFKTGYLSSFEILKYNDYRMELIDECPGVTGWGLLKQEQYHLIVNYKDVVNIIIPGKGANELCYLTDTTDVYTCSCGSNMRNCYKVRKMHSLSKMHRKKIREIHKQFNDNFEFNSEEIAVEMVYGNQGITLNIDC